MKVARAKKSTHSKGKGKHSKNTSIQDVKVRVEATVEKSVEPTEEDPKKLWEIEEIGPIYLLWGKKKVISKTGKSTKKYYIRSDDKHLVWVKWKTPFKDKPDIRWSAEVQEHFTNARSKEIIQERLASRKIWPFPSRDDGPTTGWEERAVIAKKKSYQLWQSNNAAEVGQRWRILKGINPSTGSSDTSTCSDTSESEMSDPDVEEEDDV